MATAFRVTMTGSQEVPPRSSSAIGLGTVIFNDAAVAASYSIRITGLDFGSVLNQQAQTPDPGDDVTNFHVHNATRGVNGDVVFGQINPSHDSDDLRIRPNADGSWTITGRWETTDPAAASISTFAGQLNSARIGSDVPLYFNAHTQEFTSGEIRGQWVAIANDSNNTVRGTARDDFLPGLGGNDRIFGGQGNDRLEGGLGDDRVNGGNGNDTVLGGRGNDRLAEDIDNDRLLGGSGNDSLNGGRGNDRLEGGSGRDILIGGLGTDFLIGGSNADAFRFNTALGDSNIDTVQGYNAAADTILLENSIFTGLSVGVLSAAAFRVGANAADASDRIIYNDETGNSTGFAQVQFANLLGSPSLTRFDVIVF